MSRRSARDELAEVDAVFGALAHPARRQILLVLHYRGGRMKAGDIAARFACSWPTTTRHLRTLEQAGLVRVEKRGREREYVLQRARIRAVVGDWIAQFDAPAASGKLADAAHGPGDCDRMKGDT